MTQRIAKLSKSPASYRVALEFYYQPEKPSWEQTAEHCGVTRQTLLDWRQSEEWEIVERDVRENRIQGAVGRAAVYAWIKAVEDASPQILLRTLEHLGLIGAEKREHLIGEDELNRELARALALAAIEREGGHAQASNGVAANGTPGAAGLR